MQVGAVNFQPYIYNTNSVNSASMGKVPPIPDDLTSQKTDYSGLVQSDEENTNPLRRGESANLAEIIQSQMAMAQNNAGRIMKPQDTFTDTAAAVGVDDISVDMDSAAEIDNMTAEVNTDDVTAGVNIDDMAEEVNIDDMPADIEPVVQEDDMAIETEATANNANMTVDAEAYMSTDYEAGANIANAVNIANEGTVQFDTMVSDAGSVVDASNAAAWTAAESGGITAENSASANTAQNELENITLSNNNTAAVQEAANASMEAEGSAQPQAQSQFTDMLNLFRMRRAAEAYTLSMGM